MLNEPLDARRSRPTSRTWLILWKMTSRRMPALLTRMSTRPKASSAALTICFGVLRLGDRERRGDRLAAGLLDRGDGLLRRACVVAGAVQAGADVADHDARAFLRHQLGDGAADAAPAAGDDGDFPRDNTRPSTYPRLPRRPRRSCAASPIARLPPRYCPPRSRQSRIAATGKAGRAKYISPPRSMRRLISSFASSRPVLVVTRPSTTWRSFGTSRSGSKPPARSLSYSMKIAVHLDLVEQHLLHRPRSRPSP